MKKAFTFIIGCIVLSSCSVRTIQATTTHKQVMDGFKSKDAIIARFGIPTSKKTEGEYEEWYFDYGTKTVTDAASTSQARAATTGGLSSISAAVGGRTLSGNAAAVGGTAATFGSNSAANSAARARTVTQDYKTFVKFTLKGDQVITWESNGVDYGKYEIVKQKVF